WSTSRGELRQERQYRGDERHGGPNEREGGPLGGDSIPNLRGGRLGDRAPRDLRDRQRRESLVAAARGAQGRVAASAVRRTGYGVGWSAGGGRSCDRDSSRGACRVAHRARVSCVRRQSQAARPLPGPAHRGGREG